MQHNVGGSTKIGCVTLLRRRPSALLLSLLLASIRPRVQWQEELLSISAAARVSSAPLISSIAPAAIAAFPPVSLPYTPPFLVASHPAGALAATETRGFFSGGSVCLSEGAAVVLGGPSAAYYVSDAHPLPSSSISPRLYALFDSHRNLRFVPDCNSVMCIACKGNTNLPCSRFSVPCSKCNDAHCRNTCDKSGGFTPQIYHIRPVRGARGSVRRHGSILLSSIDTESSLHSGSTRIQTVHATAARTAVVTQAVKTGTAPEAGEVWRNCCHLTIQCTFPCAKKKTRHTGGNLSKGRLSCAAQVAVPVLVALTAAPPECRPSPEAGERLLWSAATCTGSPRALRKAEAAIVVVQPRTVKKATACVAPVPAARFFSTTVATAAAATGKLQRVIDSLSAVGALVSTGALTVSVPHVAVLIPRLPAATALWGSLTATAARTSYCAHSFTSSGLSILRKGEAHCFSRSDFLPLLLLHAPVRLLRVRLTLTPTTVTSSGSEAAASVADKGRVQAAAQVPRKRPAALQVKPAAAAPAKSVLQLLSRHVPLPISLVFCISTGVVLLLHASCHSLLAFSKSNRKFSSESDKSVRMWTHVSCPAVATAARPVPTADFLTAAVLAEEVLWVLRPQMQQIVCAAFAFTAGERDLQNSCNSLSNSCGNSNKREEESSSSSRQRAGSISTKSDGGGCASDTDWTDDDSENRCGASFSNRVSHRCNSETCGTGRVVQRPERRDRERDGNSGSIYYTSVEQPEERSLLVGGREKAFREMRGDGEASQQQKQSEQLIYYSSAAAACGHRLLSLWHDAHRLLDESLQLQQVLCTQQFFEEEITREKEVSVHAGHVLPSCICPVEEGRCCIDNWSNDTGLTGGSTSINSNACGGSNRRSTCRATSAADQRNHVGETLALRCPTAIVAKQYLRQRLHLFATEVYRGLLLRLHEELLQQFSQGFACLVGGSPTFAQQATQLRCMYTTVHRKVCTAAALPVEALNLLQPCRRHTARDASTCGYISTSNSGHQWTRKALCRRRCNSNIGNDVCLQCATEKFTDAIQRLTDERKYTEGIVLEEATAAVASLQTWKLVCRVAQIATARLLPIVLQLLANHLQAKVRRLCSRRRANPPESHKQSKDSCGAATKSAVVMMPGALAPAFHSTNIEATEERHILQQNTKTP